MSTPVEKPSQLPTVRFSYSWLLTNAASGVLNEKWGDGTPLQSHAFYDETAKKYSSWWQPKSNEILAALCDITGLTFRQNIIDVHVAPWFYAFSSPLVIGVIFKDEDTLVDVVAHEITHRLLTDNTSHEYDYDIRDDWKRSFGDTHAPATLTHIPVHAILQKLYLEYLDRPDLVELNKVTVKKNEPYKKAWEYVEEKGYDWVIEQL